MNMFPKRTLSFVFAEPGNHCALYSSTNFGLFYLFEVEKTAVATENKTDLFGHIVKQGDVYLEGFYLEKVNETKHKVMYKKLNNRVYIYPETIFCPNVAFNKTDMCLDKEIYIALTQFMLT